MFFIPYRVDLRLARTPFATILICILCTLIFLNQARNERAVIVATEDFCEQPGSRLTRMVMVKAAGSGSAEACASVLWSIRLADDPQAEMREIVANGDPLAGFSGGDGRDYALNILERHYQRFVSEVPDYETQALWYQPASWNLTTMVTAAFAHSSWMHLIGNLFFFFAFSATVELIVGPVTFVALILGFAIGTHALYSVAMLASAAPAPTVGLSGVVMGLIALFTFFLPMGRIRCFLWFIFLVRTIALPAWVLALWYIGWDVFDLFHGGRPGVNLVAHVGGAGLGYLAGVVLFQSRRREVRALMRAA